MRSCELSCSEGGVVPVRVNAPATGKGACSGGALGRLARPLSWAIAVWLATGCSEGTPQTPKADGTGSPGSDAIADGAGPGDSSGDGQATGDGGTDVSGDTGGPPVVTEDFWVLYGRRNRLPGASATDNDLVLSYWKNPGAIQNASTFGIGASPFDKTKPAIELTKFSFKDAGGLTCNHGCLVSQDLQFIAIAVGPPDKDGFTFQLGRINDKLQVVVGKFGKIEKVAHIEFAQGYLFYSTPSDCLSTGWCQYDIHRRAMADELLSEGDTVLVEMPPDNDKDVIELDTTYKGYFQVSPDAQTLAFLTPTIRSVKVWSLKDGNLARLDFICDSKLDEETCVGTGSQYHDNDKVGMSPDGKTIVLFTIVDRWLRARKYTVGSEAPPSFSELVEVPSGKKYLDAVCSVLQPWQHATVIDEPEFSADGKTVYFLGYSDCGGAADKKWTDLLAMSVDKIGDGTKVGPGDIVNLTNNPRNNSTKNKRIFDFSLSPERQVVLMSATATFDSGGKPIPDGQDRAMKDSEIYTLILGDSQMVPITNELKFAADSPLGILPIATP